MELQLFLAINAMMVSAAAIAVTLLYRHPDRQAWVAVNAAVVVVGALALQFYEQSAGAIVGLLFVPLVLAPAIFSGLAVRNSNFGSQKFAARYAQLAAFFHPSFANRFNAKLAAAHLQCTDGNETPIKELIAETPPDHRAIVEIQYAQARGDWHEVLAMTQRETALTSVLKPFEIRALGELGQTDDMLHAFYASEDRLTGYNLLVMQAVVLAFGGRPQALAELFGGRLKPMQSEIKAYWSGVADLHSGYNEQAGRQSLQALANTANVRSTRDRARCQLETFEATVKHPLLVDSSQILQHIEQRVTSDTHAVSQQATIQPVTLGLIAINVLAFIAETTMGGSENAQTLLKLGALWPPAVILKGEWWRLLTASFLHFGELHLASNMFLLFVLGRTIEPALGRWRYLIVYMLGGLLSSAAVLALMWYKVSDYGYLVGASGAIFAIVGAEALLIFSKWYRTRQVSDTKSLQLLGVMLLLQFGVDISVPKISFAAHAAGFVAGLLLAAALSLRSAPTKFQKL